MPSTRRKILAASLGLLAGCSQTSPETESPTKTPDQTSTKSPDHTLPDLRLATTQSHPVFTRVAWVPPDSPEPTLDLTIEIQPDQVIYWDNVPTFTGSLERDSPGVISVTATSESGEKMEKEEEWYGDTSTDNHGAYILIEPEEIRVTTVVQ